MDGLTTDHTIAERNAAQRRCAAGANVVVEAIPALQRFAYAELTVLRYTTDDDFTQMDATGLARQLPLISQSAAGGGRRPQGRRQP